MKRNRTSSLVILAIAALGVAALTALFFVGGRAQPEVSDDAGETGSPSSTSPAPGKAVKRAVRTVAPVPWCEPSEAAQTRAGLPTLLFKPAAPLAGADETLLRASLAPIRSANLLAYVVERRPKEGAPSAIIRVLDPATRAVVCEKPWPGQRPEDWMFRAGHAALRAAGDYLSVTATAGDETVVVWFNARTGKSLPPPQLDDSRATAARIGALADGTEVWSSRARVAVGKLEAAAASIPEVAGLVCLRVHLGKPGARPAREINALDCNESGAGGLVEFAGLTPTGLLVGLVRHDSSTATLFARDPAEPKNRWNVRIADPLLRVLVQEDRVVLQHGSVLEARAPVMASVEVGDGIEVRAAADGKRVYASVGATAPVPPNGQFVARCGPVDILLGSSGGAPLPDAFFALDATTGALLWESTRTTADRLVDADSRTGRVTVLADNGRGFVFDGRTGRQLALVQIVDFHEGDHLIRIGDTWVAKSYIAAVVEQAAQEPAP
jgi:outer membrane protein assembly factor BamB